MSRCHVLRLCSFPLMLALSLTASAGAQSSSRTFYVKNSCSHDIWVGAMATPSANTSGLYPTWKGPGGATNAWHLAPKQSGRVVIPAATWISGRIWARTGCQGSWNTNNNQAGQAICVTGDCGGYQACQTANYAISGIPGVTLTEFTLQTTDNYDVSNVDGFNVPVAVAPCPANQPVQPPPPYSYESCGTAGSCYTSMPQSTWAASFITGCAASNQIFGSALMGLGTNCPAGTQLVGSTGLCVATSGGGATAQPFTSLCMSDAQLSSYPTAARGTSSVSWPANSSNPSYACPGPPAGSTTCPSGTLGKTCFTTTTCPANYHLLQSVNPNYPGVPPYINWPQWFASQCSQGAYGFTYDDAANSYVCQTWGKGNGEALSASYQIEFCPGDSKIPLTNCPPMLGSASRH